MEETLEMKAMEVLTLIWVKTEKTEEKKSGRDRPLPHRYGFELVLVASFTKLIINRVSLVWIYIDLLSFCLGRVKRPWFSRALDFGFAWFCHRGRINGWVILLEHVADFYWTSFVSLTWSNRVFAQAPRDDLNDRVRLTLLVILEMPAWMIRRLLFVWMMWHVIIGSCSLIDVEKLCALLEIQVLFGFPRKLFYHRI